MLIVFPLKEIGIPRPRQLMLPPSFTKKEILKPANIQKVNIEEKENSTISMPVSKKDTSSVTKKDNFVVPQSPAKKPPTDELSKRIATLEEVNIALIP